jgi:folate-binding protein YgfZ
MPGIANQYRTIAERAGIRRRDDRGRLRVSGTDRASFLQALLTNEIAALLPGQGAYSAYLTPQGRMIADLRVYVRPQEIITDVPGAGAERLLETLDKLIFAEDVAVTDTSTELSQYSVVGGAAAEFVARVFGVDATRLRQLTVWSQLDTKDGFVARTDDARVESFDVFAPQRDAPSIRQQLVEAGSMELTDDLWESIRVDAGRPAFGVDMDSDTIPLEAGLLERAISTTKGCYVGQEVVIRVLHRGGGRVARRLAKLNIPGVAAQSLAPGALLRSGDRDAGKITSVAMSLDGTGVTALAYVRRELAEVGNEVEVEGVIPAKAVITSLAG